MKIFTPVRHSRTRPNQWYHIFAEALLSGHCADQEGCVRGDFRYTWTRKLQWESSRANIHTMEPYARRCNPEAYESSQAHFVINLPFHYRKDSKKHHHLNNEKFSCFQKNIIISTSVGIFYLGRNQGRRQDGLGHLTKLFRERVIKNICCKIIIQKSERERDQIHTWNPPKFDDTQV